jgi:hypothetical protein
MAMTEVPKHGQAAVVIDDRRNAVFTSEPHAPVSNSRLFRSTLGLEKFEEEGNGFELLAESKLYDRMRFPTIGECARAVERLSREI